MIEQWLERYDIDPAEAPNHTRRRKAGAFRYLVGQKDDKNMSEYHNMKRKTQIHSRIPIRVVGSLPFQNSNPMSNMRMMRIGITTTRCNQCKFEKFSDLAPKKS